MSHLRSERDAARTNRRCILDLRTGMLKWLTPLKTVMKRR